MPRRLKKEFSEKVKLKCLLWSNRHCCVCDKACGLDIEIAHIDPKGKNNFDNAIPVCYFHHAQIGRYNEQHPRGNKYRIKELKRRREQIYEKYTRHLVPPIHFRITQRIRNDPHHKRHLPSVGFIMEHYGDSLPIRLKVVVKVFLGSEDLGPITSPKKPYYSGDIIWNFNPRRIFFGNFGVPKKCLNSTEYLTLEVQVTIIDQYDRPHELYPVCYTYMRDENDWYLEPTSFSELRRFMYPPVQRAFNQN